MPVLVTDAHRPLAQHLVVRLLDEGGEVRAYTSGDASQLRVAGACVAHGTVDDDQAGLVSARHRSQPRHIDVLRPRHTGGVFRRRIHGVGRAHPATVQPKDVDGTVLGGQFADLRMGEVDEALPDIRMLARVVVVVTVGRGPPRRPVVVVVPVGFGEVGADAEALRAIYLPHLDRPEDQLDPVERAVILVGVLELRERMEVPYRVVLDEAVSLARRYGAEDSHRYVNAVLDRVAAELRGEERGGGGRRDRAL
jgi:hypothetical protein